MPSFIDKEGKQQEVTFSPTILREAKAENHDLRQHINLKYPTCSETESFQQMCASEGLFFGSNDAYAINSTPLKDILGFDAKSNVSDAVPASRLLFPTALLQATEATMKKDLASPTAVFDSLVALTTTVPGPRVLQPILDYDGVKGGPTDYRASRSSQLALPTAMMLIKVAEKTRTIPTYTMGLGISDEAMEAGTLDFVSLCLARQRETVNFQIIGESLMECLNGNVDNGQGALPVKTAASFDSSITTAGTLSQRAYVLWLHEELLKRRIDTVIVDSIETAMAIENRTGQPTVQTDDPKSPRIHTTSAIIYPNLVKNVQIFVCPKEFGMPANTIMGLQRSQGLWKMVNSLADYEATENWAMRRGTALRFDHSAVYLRLQDEAFSVLTLTV